MSFAIYVSQPRYDGNDSIVGTHITRAVPNSYETLALPTRLADDLQNEVCECGGDEDIFVADAIDPRIRPAPATLNRAEEWYNGLL